MIGGSGATDALTPDYERFRRRGGAEAVYCEGKTPGQCAKAASLFKTRAQSDNVGTILFTRADESRAQAILEILPDAFYDADARLLAWPPKPPSPSGGRIVVATAGTSDYSVAREAALTARYLGRRVEEVHDIGVAGLHRVLEHLDLLRSARTIVVVAGMEGALVPVIAGLVAVPVVAVPTSVGYGVSQNGITAMSAMLSSCAPGVGVVNIDNGYGGGYLAAQIAYEPEESAHA